MISMLPSPSVTLAQWIVLLENHMKWVFGLLFGRYIGCLFAF